MSYIGIIITFTIINNVIFNQFLGLCPFIGVSKNLESAIGMGFAVTFVMTIANIVTWIVFYVVLVPLGLDYLQTVTFILVIASLVQLVEMAIEKFSPPLYRALGIYLPLITTNCAVLGVALIAVRKDYGPLESMIAGLAAGLGFMLALILMSSIRERMQMEWVPEPFKGVPIAFISGGLMAMAFMAFDITLLRNLIP